MKYITEKCSRVKNRVKGWNRKRSDKSRRNMEGKYHRVKSEGRKKGRKEERKVGRKEGETANIR